MSPDLLKKGSGWWATPNTMDHLPQRSAESTEKMMQGARKGRARPSNLREQVNPDTMQMWATPDASPRGSRAADLVKNGSTVERRGSGQLRGIDLQTQVKMWPTPQAADHKNMDTAKQTMLSSEVKLWPTPTANEDACGTPNGKMQKMLGNHPEVRNTGVGTLNPEFVTWLMGYPRGWTDLTDGSESQPISQE
tara:strand:- start:98 stop:676 length:579 start_codon:yes stop_codon:yes gene_type:complete